jgi:hypothetical protein
MAVNWPKTGSGKGKDVLGLSSNNPEVMARSALMELLPHSRNPPRNPRRFVCHVRMQCYSPWTLKPSGRDTEKSQILAQS